MLQRFLADTHRRASREPALGVQLFGQPLRAVNRAEAARRRAVLPQHTAASFAFEVLDVVLLRRIPHGQRETTHVRRVAAECLARVGLAGYELPQVEVRR